MEYKNKWIDAINAERVRYEQLCEQEPSICVFLQAYWQKAVCINDQWSAVLYEKGGIILGSLVFCYTVKRKGIIIAQPVLTQTNGVWIREYSGKTLCKKLEYEKEVFTALINKLEMLPIIQYRQHFTVEIRNWLPFYWKRFQQTTRYTYRIMDIRNLEDVTANFSQAKRKNIKHATELGLSVKFDISVDEFYANHEMTLKKQGQSISYEYKTIKSIVTESYKRNAGRTIYAYDMEGNIYAALLIVWDKCCAYDLVSTIDPDFRNSGAATLLILEMIRYLAGIGICQFDFEGSMIEGVENSFRQFGTEQLQYFALTKDYRNPQTKAVDIILSYARSVMRKLVCEVKKVRK